MITFSRLGSFGQLGNQLFEYCLLLGVSAKTGYRIKLPPARRGRHKKAGLIELDKFRISKNDLLPGELSQVKNSYFENGFEFDPEVFEQPDFTDFHGYYQSEKYFSHIEDVVRKELRFKEPIETYAKQYINMERQQPCIVAVHVRRGDYLERPDLFHVLTKEYYNQAMSDQILPNHKQFFFFSDDLNWCRNNFWEDEQITFVETPSHWHDMAVMSFCDAHIISASSFGWFGSYLANSKITIAPYPWFPKNGPRENFNVEDIYRSKWIKQEV